MVVTIEQLSKYEERHTDYYRCFEWDNNTGCGFSFESYVNGDVIMDNLSDVAKDSLKECLNGLGVFADEEVPIIDNGVKKRIYTVHRCKCDSNLEEFWLTDCHNIALCLVCNNCIDEKKTAYHSWVFTGYTDEDVECPIEAEE